jgi:small conductance mechanosensitive channel
MNVEIPTLPELNLSDIDLPTWGTALLLIVIGFMAASFISSLISKPLAKHTSPHYTLLVRRLFYYIILFIFGILALGTLNLDIQAWGAAGILTLAIGFASQTAISNIISGLFLVFERPFVIGDELELLELLGEVLSTDLLSIKLRTKDNTLVRIPNEVLIKTEFKNLSRFPIRRLDLVIHISYHEDVEKIKSILYDLAKKNCFSLETPAPELLFEAFDIGAIKYKFVVWAKKSVFFDLKNSFPCEIHQAFQANNIQMPSTHHKIFNYKN